MNRVELIGMEFFAHHGCFSEEQIIGNKFIVDFWAEVDMSIPAESDNIEDALNYQEVYNVIAEQMAISSHLLENVAHRILLKVKERFPYVVKMGVKIDKLNPPLGGKLYSSRVRMEL